MFQTNFRYFFTNAPWLLLNNASLSLGSLLVAVAASHFLDPHVYGTYKYILTVGILATIFSLSGSGTVLLRATAKGTAGALPYLFRKNLLFGLISSVILLGIAAYYYLNGDTTFALSFLVIAALQPIYEATQLYQPFINGLQKYKTFAFTGIIKSAVATLGIALGMILFDSPLLLVVTYFVTYTTITSLLFLFVRARYEVPKQEIENKESPDSLFNYSVHLSVMNVLGKIANQLDNILAFQILGAAQLATYAFSKLPVEQLFAQNKVLNNLIAPRFSKHSEATLRSNIHLKALMLFAAGATLSILYIFAAPYIFELLFPQYVSAVFYSQILSLSFLTFPSMLYSEAFTALAKTKELYLTRTLTPIARIALFVSLTPFLGLLGLILAVVGARIFSMLLSMFMFYWKAAKKITVDPHHKNLRNSI